jgi:hypothetical protein
MTKGKVTKKVKAFFRMVNTPETRAKIRESYKATQRVTHNLSRGIEDTLPRPQHRPAARYSLTQTYQQPSLGRLVVKRRRY